MDTPLALGDQLVGGGLLPTYYAISNNCRSATTTTPLQLQLDFCRLRMLHTVRAPTVRAAAIAVSLFSLARSALVFRKSSKIFDRLLFCLFFYCSIIISLL